MPSGRCPPLPSAGVRNTVGFDFHPQSKQLFFTDNGRDQISDNVPDCELNRVSKEGACLARGSASGNAAVHRMCCSTPRSSSPRARASACCLVCIYVILCVCALALVGLAGEHFGFPFCHTRPAGGSNPRPYLRRPGRGANLADPDVNRLEAVWKCNGPGLRFTPAVQALGPHVAPLGMVSKEPSAGQLN